MMGPSAKSFWKQHPRHLLPKALMLILGCGLLSHSCASAAEPLMVVLKDTLLGGTTGLVLGGTLSLVLDDDSRSEAVRWGVVIGTFGGFAVGVAVAARSEGDFLAEATAAGEPLTGWAALRCSVARAQADLRNTPSCARCPVDPRDAPRGMARVRVPLLQVRG